MLLRSVHHELEPIFFVRLSSMVWLPVQRDEGQVFGRLTYGETLDISKFREEKPKMI